jgi:hypothetical protein
LPQVEEIMLLNTKVKRWDGACIYVRAWLGSTNAAAVPSLRR